MGIKLMVEILDHWQDAGLTLGERSDLLVLAENANDGTRETWPKGGVHQEYMRKRAGKTAGSWKNAIAKLMKKGVLSYAVRDGRELTGFPGQAAVYRIASLCPEVPHDGLMGQCTRLERVTSEVTLSEGDAPGKGHLPEGMGHLSGGKGHLPEGERVTPEVTPTPPYPSSKSPSTTSSTSPADPSADVPQSDPEVTNGGGGGSDLRSTAIHIAASLDYQGKPPTRKQRQLIEDRLLIWLEAGWSMDGLVVILDIAGQGVRHAPTVYALRLDPAEMPAPDTVPVPAAARGGARGVMPSAEEYAELTVEDVLGDGRPKAPSKTWAEAQANARQRVGVGASGGTDGNVAGWMNLSRGFAAKEPHKPYSDDAWRRPATPEEAARYPWCGDLDCHEATRMRDGVGDDGLPNVAQCHKCHPNYQPF